TLDIVLQRYRAVPIDDRGALECLSDPFGAVATSPGAVKRVRVVVRGNALVGAGHIAPRRIDRTRQSLEGDVTLPHICRLVRVAIPARAPATDWHTPGALKPDSVRGISESEI